MGPEDAYRFNPIYVLATRLDLDVFGPPQLGIRGRINTYFSNIMTTWQRLSTNAKGALRDQNVAAASMLVRKLSIILEFRFRMLSTEPQIL
jgi:hypothetical protein